MKTFNELYAEMLGRQFQDESPETEDFNPIHLDCLLNPAGHTPVRHQESCEACAYDRACENSCLFDAIEEIEGGFRINPEKCMGCEACVDACEGGNILPSKDVFPVLQAVREKDSQVYALIAPAISGQFDENATPGRIRSSLKAIGFKGMVECAAFADILTLKEALEFDEHINEEADFMLTSCCCPMWLSMIRRDCPGLFDHMPASVSPMVAAGRVVKILNPGAVTVFIGPCMAKKKEAKEADISDAVDYVLTFRELQEIFEAAKINPSEMPDDEKEHSSRAGRIYAREGGVTEAVRATVEQLNPHRKIPLRAETANGALACKKLIGELKEGTIRANFYEGMGCAGGCVGGPKKLIETTQGREAIDAYGDTASYRTPLDNPYIKELLHQLGYETVGELLEKSDFLTRDFNASTSRILTP